MLRVVLLCLAVGLALCAVLALAWQTNEAPQDGVPLEANRPSADPEPEPDARADGPDGPRLESGVPLERRLAQRAARLGLPRGGWSPTTIETLANTPGWTRFLQVWLLLPAEQDAAAQLARLEQTLALASNPVVRQNLIFLVGLALPAELATPWLATLSAGADPADAEDSLVALAVRGNPAALAAFERLAGTPSSVDARHLMDDHETHDELGATSTPEARERLRSYRAIEVHLGEPYFKLTAYLASRQWGGGAYGELLHWQPKVVLERTAKERLLKAWLARYPGHPGSDNVALWLAQLSAERGDHLEAARWCSRAAVWPDQDMSYRAQVRLVGICEVRLAPEEVHSLSTEEGLSTPNRLYYIYVWLRRLAAERGPEQGLRAWAAAATQDPDSDLGVAWARRFACAPCIGIDSGLAPLPADDPLRRMDAQAPPWPESKNPNLGVYGPYGPSSGLYSADAAATRLHPWPEPMLLDRPRLERQARAWETLAELERRTQRARGDAQAELLYKQAAILYHDRDIYFPAYGDHSSNFRYDLSDAQATDSGGEETRSKMERSEYFERTSFAWLRALALFERIEREHPRWAAGDKVLYSQALAWRRLVDYRPHYTGPDRPYGNTQRAEDAKRAVACFDRLISLYPESPLVPDARAAVAWWHKQHEDMLR